MIYKSIFLKFLLALPFLALSLNSGAQMPDLRFSADSDLAIKKIILDAEDLQNSASFIPFLAEERAVIEGILNSLENKVGYQRTFRPISINEIGVKQAAEVEGILNSLKKAMQDARIKLQAHRDEVQPEDLWACYTIMSENPGAYYYGVDEESLCGNSLKDQMESIQLQDIGFEEVLADGDTCLWNMYIHAPNLRQVIAFAAELNDESLARMQLERLRKLQVLDLAENSLTVFPDYLMESGSLEVLDLRRNKITALPQNLAPLRGLKYLNLAGNQIPEGEKARILAGLKETQVKF